MAIRLFVEARNIRASVSHAEAKIVAPAFTRAAISVTQPVFETVTSSRTLEALTSFIALKSQTSFVDMQFVDVRLDPDTLNKYFRDDTVSFTDQPVFSTTKALSDQFEFSDLPVFDFTKAPSDSFQLLEDFSVTLQFTRDFTDSVTFSDVPALSVALGPTDTFGATDAIQSFSVTKGLTDSATVTENLQKTMTVDFGSIESVTVEDTFSRTVAYSRAPTEVFTFSHDVSFQNELGKTDTATVTDSPALDVTSSQEDSFGMADSPALHPNISAGDTFSFGDVFSRVVSFSRTFSDSFTLDDAATVDALQKDYEGVKGNIVSIAETLSFSQQKQIADSFSFTDVPAISLSTSASDSVSFTDAASISGTYQLSDTATMSDSLTSHLSDTSSSVINADAFNLGTFNV